MARRGIPKEQMRLNLPLMRQEEERLKEQQREQTRQRNDRRQYWRRHWILKG